MGASNFVEFASAKTAREAFDNLIYDIAQYIDEDDPYNTTMATCELVDETPAKIADVWSADVAKLATNYASEHEWGEKWCAHPLDCGRDTDNPGCHVWAFFGLAAT